jgi:hypothetical protein
MQLRGKNRSGNRRPGTAATLFLLPAVYAMLRGGASTHSASLDPTDARSKYFVPSAGPE